ncbi:MAG: hypothetical protein Q8M94_06255 [Ignavibacteria bacterium]|nr:hypothetical protein [Ignavibacteria bacterium]
MDAIKNTKVKAIIVAIALLAIISLGLSIYFNFALYKARDIERKKVVNEVYQLYNKDSSKSMHEALLKTCIGDEEELGSYVKAEKGKITKVKKKEGGTQ